MHFTAVIFLRSAQLLMQNSHSLLRSSFESSFVKFQIHLTTSEQCSASEPITRGLRMEEVEGLAPTRKRKFTKGESPHFYEIYKRFWVILLEQILILLFFIQSAFQ